jgi:Protein of unknown function (DUF2637)
MWALRFGERPEVAWLLPFSVDGMLVVASVAMVDDKRSDRRIRPMARIASAVVARAGEGMAVRAEAADWTKPVWPRVANGRRLYESLTSHSRTAWSQLLVARTRPSGLTASEGIWLSRPTSGRSRNPATGRFCRRTRSPPS